MYQNIKLMFVERVFFQARDQLGLGFGVWGLGFLGFEFWVWGLRFRVSGFGSGGSCLGFSLGLRIEGCPQSDLGFSLGLWVEGCAKGVGCTLEGSPTVVSLRHPLTPSLSYTASLPLSLPLSLSLPLPLSLPHSLTLSLSLCHGLRVFGKP